MILIDYKWYWIYYTSIAWCVLEFDDITKTFVAYIWVWNSWDEELDIDIISMHWNKIPRNVAVAIFWDIEYQWYYLYNNYKTN